MMAVESNSSDLPELPKTDTGLETSDRTSYFPGAGIFVFIVELINFNFRAHFVPKAPKIIFFNCSVAPPFTFQSLFILCFQHWFFSKWHIFQFISVWSQMWISSTHIMLIRKSSRRCQKWGTIIIVTFYVFVKYSILGIISPSSWIICFFNFF